MGNASQPRALDESQMFKNAMRCLAGGVCAISVGDDKGWGGLVATSVTSFSISPPSLLFCVNRNASAWPLIQRTGRFAVNVLGWRHKEVALRFAGSRGEKGRERFAGAEWMTTDQGTPYLADAVISVECDVREVIERYTHAIVLGDVRQVMTANPDAALVYLQGSFSPVQSDTADQGSAA